MRPCWGSLPGAHWVLPVLARAEPAPRCVLARVRQPPAGERRARGVERPAAFARPGDVAPPVAGAAGARALDAQDAVDRAGADLVDRDRRRDGALDLRLARTPGRGRPEL